MGSVKSVTHVLKAKTLQNYISWLSVKPAHAGDQKHLVSVSQANLALQSHPVAIKRTEKCKWLLSFVLFCYILDYQSVNLNTKRGGEEMPPIFPLSRTANCPYLRRRREKLRLRQFLQNLYHTPKLSSQSGCNKLHDNKDFMICFLYLFSSMKSPCWANTSKNCDYL